MRDYWLTQYILAAVGWGYIIATLIAIALALWLPKGRKAKASIAAVVIGLASILPIQGYQEYRTEQQAIEVYKARLAKAQALFAERCKTAGEKIYRTVENVEGVLLLNIRQSDRPGIRDNPMWPDAALPDEFGGEGYIRTFLLWEHLQSGQTQQDADRAARSYLNPTPTSLPGYRYVDVKQADGTVLRYRLKDPRNQDSVELLSEIVSGKPSRYAIGFVNQVKPEDRAHWVAGTTITVTDTQTNDVIATRESYSLETGLGSKEGARQPWGFATVCPKSGRGSSPTRFFVDQILKPNKGE